MPIANLEEAKELDPYLERMVTATSTDKVLDAVRALWVERLDFESVQSSVALHGDGLPLAPPVSPLAKAFRWSRSSCRRPAVSSLVACATP